MDVLRLLPIQFLQLYIGFLILLIGTSCTVLSFNFLFFLFCFFILFNFQNILGPLKIFRIRPMILNII